MRLNKITLAARHSDLARLQAYRVGDALRAVQPDLKVEYQFRASLGDKNQSDPLWKMPEKGVFTEDFLKDLTTGTADLVVHSWKDLPTEPRPDTEIVATLPRADSRDLLLFKRDRIASASETGRVRILTSSPRRAHNLGEFFRTHLPFEVTTVAFENVRGNIPTRLKKLLDQDVEGLIVAKAALDRLLSAPEAEFSDVQTVIRDALARTCFMVLPLSVNPTAAAQGALAVEIKRGREDLKSLLNKINCPATFEAVIDERRILSGYGGGCHQKIGVSVLPKSYGRLTFLKGLTDGGEVLDRVELQSAGDAAPTRATPKPSPQEAPTFFDREPLPRSEWEWAEAATALWIARETAVPLDFHPAKDALIWTAGLKTWRKLAERGFWVSGTADGLGEDEPTLLDSLVGHELSWVKLSHAASPRYQVDEPSEERMKLCATYRLVTRATAPDLTGRDHFHWMSASSFERALELYPEIVRKAEHTCGPGLTLKYLRRVLGPDARVNVRLIGG